MTRPRSTWRTLGPVAVAAAVAPPAAAQILRSVELAPPATWGQMIGLTQNEISRRLGLAPTGQIMASGGVRLEDGVRVVEIPYLDLIGAPCGTAGWGQRAMTNIPPTLLTFRDDKLVQVRQLYGGLPPANLTQTFEATCDLKRHVTDSADLAMLPLGVFTIPGAIGRNTRKHAEWEAFSELRLGRAPPGGAEAWAEKHRDFTSLAQGADGEQELDMKVQTNVGVQTNKAVIRDGVIAELKPWGWSTRRVLRDDGSLACDQHRYF